MCFSAGASFGASALLAGMGVVTIKKNRDPLLLLFASVPLLFSVQQFAEGLVWLAMPEGGTFSGRLAPALFFLAFAQVLWPIWIPLSIYLPEKNVSRRKILSVLSFTGTLLAIYNAVCLFVYTPGIAIKEHHISYIVGHPDEVKWITTVFYIIVSIAPLFISSYAKMKLVGWSILFALLVSAVFYRPSIISVWCYFAAVISITVFVVVDSQRKKSPEKIKSIT